MYIAPLKHCRACGTAVVYRLPDDGDTRQRGVCPACCTVHYQNPLNVVGTVPIWDEGNGEGDDYGDCKVLLCKRNIEPRRGKWTLPAGFMELSETTAEGAARETVEESGAQFEMQELFTLINVVRVGQVTAPVYSTPALSRAMKPCKPASLLKPKSHGTKSLSRQWLRRCGFTLPTAKRDDLVFTPLTLSDWSGSEA